MLNRYKYLIGLKHFSIKKHDLVKWSLKPNETYFIVDIYTFHGNPGCFHDRIKLRNIETKKVIDTSMIMFSDCEVYRKGRWQSAIVVEY